ncbi:hypothetical protein MRX96_007281 [Rhipicephalus microplus]
MAITITGNFNRRDAVWHRRLGGDHPAQQEDLGQCRNSTSSFAPTPRMRAAQPIRAQSIKRVNANFAKKARYLFRVEWRVQDRGQAPRRTACRQSNDAGTRASQSECDKGED